MDLAPSVLCSVVEHGSETEWDSVWKIITSDVLGGQTWRSVKALGCTKQPSLIKVNDQFSIELTLANI